ncbi:hypothetical protein QFZ87_003650 [Bacillus sp. SLBN-46]|nr:hypothetical protein [Bacillus sp. SLBN-46]
MHQDYVKKLERLLLKQNIDISNNPHGFIFDVENEIESFRENVEINEEFTVDRTFGADIVRFYCAFEEDELNGVIRVPYAINSINIITPSGNEISVDFSYLD